MWALLSADSGQSGGLEGDQAKRQTSAKGVAPSQAQALRYGIELIVAQPNMDCDFSFHLSPKKQKKPRRWIRDPTSRLSLNPFVGFEFSLSLAHV
jgi:hypothetical protein